ELRSHYAGSLTEPVITKDWPAKKGEAALKFPTIETCFIPQSFQVVQTGSEPGRLEPNDVWEEAEPRNDLNAFVLSMLSSPYSTERPILILGHPGSGKSLLTKVLAARLGSDSWTPIRVALREVDADVSIPTQIEQAINRTINRPTAWADLSSELVSRPPVVILDGFDELLQATGKVYRSYLQDVRQFQERQLRQERPLRIIVTSRITLIDKAAVPDYTTVIRFLDFDQRRQKRWGSIWNRTNRAAFRKASPAVDEFELPPDEDVLELARQPLLLLMLALYDSSHNSLHSGPALDRCSLYDSLIRRFVERELFKDSEYRNSEKERLERRIKTEVDRLGVAALGMFLRGAVHIHSTDLGSDLAFYEPPEERGEGGGRKLAPSDLLLGSFFFVHKSKTTLDENEDRHEAAFEFLHNTFGEFLAADYLLELTLDQLETIGPEPRRRRRRAGGQYRQRAIIFDEKWVSSLSFSLLSSRPVIVEMFREWAPAKFAADIGALEEMQGDLDTLLYGGLRKILLGQRLDWLVTRTDVQSPEPSLLTLAARFSFNLVRLRLALAGREYEVDEEKLARHRRTEDEPVRPWDRLANLWWSQIGIEELAAAAATAIAVRAGTSISLTRDVSERFGVSEDRLVQIVSANEATGNQLGRALSGTLLRHEYGSFRKESPDLLREEGVPYAFGEVLDHASGHLFGEPFPPESYHALSGDKGVVMNLLGYSGGDEERLRKYHPYYVGRDEAYKQFLLRTGSGLRHVPHALAVSKMGDKSLTLLRRYLREYQGNYDFENLARLVPHIHSMSPMLSELWQVALDEWESESGLSMPLIGALA
ncbi:MAG: ATP-binding protein, partial [Verrucomicrobiota bacterium]